MPDTPEWRKALRDLASIATGAFMLLHESFVSNPNETRMYIGAVLLAGPPILRVFGK